MQSVRIDILGNMSRKDIISCPVYTSLPSTELDGDHNRSFLDRRVTTGSRLREYQPEDIPVVQWTRMEDGPCV